MKKNNFDLSDWVDVSDLLDKKLKKVDVKKLEEGTKDVIKSQLDEILAKYWDKTKMVVELKKGTSKNPSLDLVVFQLYAKMQEPTWYTSIIDGDWWPWSAKAFKKYEAQSAQKIEAKETKVEDTDKKLNALEKKVNAAWSIEMSGNEVTLTDLNGKELKPKFGSEK